MTEVVEVYRASNDATAHMLMLWLQERGINATLNEGGIHDSSGQVPPGWSIAPQIWVHEADAEQARTAIAEWESTIQHHETEPKPPGWTCPKCDAEVDAGFDVCWKCLYNPNAC